MFVMTTRGGKHVANLQTVEEALVADAANFSVEAVGRGDVLALAAARCEASPDYNQQPECGEEWVKFTSKAGRLMICQVVRLTHPDTEGYPQLLELVNPARPDNSFLAQASSCKVLDTDSLSPELFKALTEGVGAEPETASSPKIKHGLRR